MRSIRERRTDGADILNHTVREISKTEVRAALKRTRSANSVSPNYMHASRFCGVVFCFLFVFDHFLLGYLCSVGLAILILQFLLLLLMLMAAGFSF